MTTSDMDGKCVTADDERGEEEPKKMAIFINDDEKCETIAKNASEQFNKQDDCV